MLKTLEENIKKFEKQFGEIKLPSGPEGMHGAKIGFETSTNGENKGD